MRSTADDRRVWTLIVFAIVVQFAMTAATAAGKLRDGRDDTDLYFRYATEILDGKVPYRDVRIEYPPLSLPVFLLPALLTQDIDGFKVAFALEMLCFNAATVMLVASSVERGHLRIVLIRYTIGYLLLSRLMVLRYDPSTMFVGFASALWWGSGFPVRGGIAAGLGALMKVYPAVLAMIAAPGDLKRAHGRGIAAFTVVVLLGALGWLVVGGIGGVAGSLRYQLGRGFEYGSLYSGLQMLAAKLAGDEIDIIRDRAAWASVTPWTSSLLPMVLPIQASAILLVGFVQVRRGGAEPIRSSAAAILAFILTGKVFSPQYLIWLLPFVATLEGTIARRGFWLFAAGCAAALIAPGLTNSFSRTSLPVILAYNLKNAMFLALLIVLTVRPSPAPST